MTRFTLFFRFADEATAITALVQFRLSEGGWDAARIDADIPIVAAPAVFDATGDLVSPAVRAEGYFVNLLLTARDDALEAIDGWRGTAEEQDGAWVLIAGDHPRTPQRVFA